MASNRPRPRQKTARIFQFPIRSSRQYNAMREALKQQNAREKHIMHRIGTAWLYGMGIGMVVGFVTAFFMLNLIVICR